MSANNMRELPVVLQKKFNTNLYHAYPLCVLLSNVNYQPWFYENYIQLWGIEWNYKWIDIGLTDSFWTGYTGGKYTELLDVTALDYDIAGTIPSIRTFIQKKIDNNSYLVMFVDEFFIPTSHSYHQKHFTHEYLIYGYDFPKNTYFAIGFDSHNVFTKLQIDTDCFDDAFKNAGELYKERDDVSWLQAQSIVLLRDKKLSGQYPFSLEKLLENLKMYYDGNVPASVQYLHNFDALDVNTVTYGIECYKTVFRILEYALSGGVGIDYKVLHLLYENKVSIYDRLKYVVENFHAESSLNSIITAYEEVVKAANISRLKFLKISQFVSRADLKDTYKAGLEDILKILSKSMLLEKQVLTQAIECLSTLG